MRQADPEIVVVGEALVDVIRPSSGAPERRHAGGSPANVALGLARLGRPVHLVTELGDDTDGDLVRRRLGDDGVELHVAPTATRRTATAVAEMDGGGMATYTFDLTWTLMQASVEALPKVGELEPGVVHVGSIGALLAPGADAVERFAAERRDTAVITYDPNLRPMLLGEADVVRPQVERLVASADVVKVSDEDLAWLYPSVSAEEVARAWATSGPQLVVCTRGGTDVLAVHVPNMGEPVVYQVAVPSVEVVDTVGAGDAFMAGVIDGLVDHGVTGAGARARVADLDADSVRRILDRGAAVAAVTVTRSGAEPPTATDLGPWK